MAWAKPQSLGVDLKVIPDAIAKGVGLGLTEQEARRAIAIAVNATARQVSTMAARLVAKEGGFKAKDAKRQFYIRSYARFNSLSATVVATGYAMPLMSFNARQTKTGVKAKAWGQVKEYKGAFIQTLRTGHTSVFARTSKKRLPIRQLWGPSVPSVMAQGFVMASVEAHADSKLDANIKRQLDRAWRKKSGLAG